MAVSSVNDLLGSSSAPAAANKTAQDKDMFLKLLVAQLSNQDPLNPIEDKEFIAQLAQFTQLEEMQKISSNMEIITAANERAQFYNASGLIGATIVAEGSSISKAQYKVPVYDDNGDPVMEADGTTPKTEIQPGASDVYYSSDVDIKNVTVSINLESGYTIYSKQLDPMIAGETYRFTWDCTGIGGMEMPNGVYSVSFTATDANGAKQLLKTEVAGQIYSVENVDGEILAHLVDGRKVKYTDISMFGTQLNS